MKKMKSISKKAIISALAISIGTAASATAVDRALKDPLFSLKEVGTQSVLLAHGEGKCGEGKCGEGKCGEGKCGDSKDKAKSVEGKCGEGKCGVKKLKKIFKKDKTKKAKSAEAKCGEGKCGEGKCGADKEKKN